MQQMQEQILPHPGRLTSTANALSLLYPCAPVWCHQRCFISGPPSKTQALGLRVQCNSLIMLMALIRRVEDKIRSFQAPPTATEASTLGTPAMSVSVRWLKDPDHHHRERLMELQTAFTACTHLCPPFAMLRPTQTMCLSINATVTFQMYVSNRWTSSRNYLEACMCKPE